MDRKYAEYLLEKTKEDYNLIAEEFSGTRQKIWPEMQFLLDKYLSSGKMVLDLGCGNGRYFEYLKKRSVNYFGVDNSEKLIKIAKNKYPEGNFQVADALNLPFSDNFFDKIFSIAVLHHIPSEELRFRFLEEAKRILKPEGLLILTVWNLWQWRSWKSNFKYIFLKILGLSKLDFKDVLVPWGKTHRRYFHCFSTGELKKQAERVGLKIKEAGILQRPDRKGNNIYLIAGK